MPRLVESLRELRSVFQNFVDLHVYSANVSWHYVVVFTAGKLAQRTPTQNNKHMLLQSPLTELEVKELKIRVLLS